MVTRYIKSGELVKVTNKSSKNGYVLITRIIKPNEVIKITNANYDAGVIIFNKDDSEDEIIKEIKRLNIIKEIKL